MRNPSRDAPEAHTAPGHSLADPPTTTTHALERAPARPGREAPGRGLAGGRERGRGNGREG